MTPQWIEVDDEVIGTIKDAAEPFVDNPNRVLRRLLGLPAIDDDQTAPLPSTAARRGPRAPSGSILPMADFELPILRAIFQAGGSAPRPVVLEAVEVALRDRLTAVDRESLASGEVRWRARASGARVKLADRGHIAVGDRGIWALTEAGINELKRLEADAAAEGRAT